MYDLKVKYEIQGRRSMQQKAIKLSMKNFDETDVEQAELAAKMKQIISNLEYKEKIKNDNYYFKLL